MSQKNNGNILEISTIYQILHKALAKNSQWGDKDELLDVLYWGRQILALILGLLWGYFPFKGFLAIVFYVIFSTLGGHFYIVNYQKQDEEVFGGFWEISREGFGASFATFMVSWITCYSAVHFGEQNKSL